MIRGLSNNGVSLAGIKGQWTNISIAIAVVALLVIGALYRLDDLGARTVNHGDTYVPGLDFPYGLSVPSPRQTPWETLRGTLAQDVHPPAYYLSMWPWTRLLGNDVFIIRLPSVVYGVASIFLIYVVGALWKDRLTGLVAAVLLAFNGFHAFWSQLARPTSMAFFLGLLSTALLLVATRESQHRRLLLFAYAIVTLAGMSTLYYFWLIFATHILWVFWKSWGNGNLNSGLLRLQLMVLILASPLLTVAIFQSQTSYLGANLYLAVSEFVQFGFLFHNDGFTASPLPYFVTLSLPFIPLVVLVFLVLGLAAKKPDVPWRNSAQIIGPQIWLLALLAALSFLLITGGTLFDMFNGARPNRTYLMLVSGIFPLFVFLVAFLVQRPPDFMRRLGVALTGRRQLYRGSPSLIVLLAIVPMVGIIVISFIIPFFAPRHMLLFAPYLLITLSGGIVYLSQKTRRFAPAALVVILLLLLAVHYPSHGYHQQNTHSALEYQALAEQWVPKIQDSDLIFLRKSYRTTPIFYYLNADDYNLVAKNYDQAVRLSPDSRVWVLSFEGAEFNEEALSEALAGFAPVTRIESERKGRAIGQVELYVRQ